jgi:hypothetical protein
MLRNYLDSDTDCTDASVTSYFLIHPFLYSQMTAGSSIIQRKGSHLNSPTAYGLHSWKIFMNFCAMNSLNE